MNRDDLVKVLYTEITKVGLADNVEKVVKVQLLAGVTKMIINGRTKYDVVTQLNKHTRTLGNDIKYVAKDVYEVIKDVDF